MNLHLINELWLKQYRVNIVILKADSIEGDYSSPLQK